jgi:hypothetical protein
VGSSKASSDDAVGLAAPCTTATFIPLLLHEDGSIQGKTPEIDFDCLNSQLCVEDLSVREATTGHEVHITCDTWWRQVNAITGYKFLQLQQLFIMFRILPHQNYNCHRKKLNCEGSFWVEILVPSKEGANLPSFPQALRRERGMRRRIERPPNAFLFGFQWGVAFLLAATLSYW